MPGAITTNLRKYCISAKYIPPEESGGVTLTLKTTNMKILYYLITIFADFGCLP